MRYHMCRYFIIYTWSNILNLTFIKSYMGSNMEGESIRRKSQKMARSGAAVRTRRGGAAAWLWWCKRGGELLGARLALGQIWATGLIWVVRAMAVFSLWNLVAAPPCADALAARRSGDAALCCVATSGCCAPAGSHAAAVVELGFMTTRCCCGGSPITMGWVLLVAGSNGV
jgi:hypothetical protein